jgi:hypothetical protein
MTKKSQATKLKLLQDIEAYTCGEVPSPLAMMRAAKMENWVTTVRRRGKEFVFVVKGDVYRHPEIEDGRPISTSAISWFDRHARFCRTNSRVYALGEPAGGDMTVEGDA